MKKIDCSLKITDPITFTMKDFIMYLIDNHESFQKDAKSVRAAVRIEGILKSTEVDDNDSLSFDDVDVEMLSNAAENPGPIGYPAAVGQTQAGEVKISLSRKCLPFIDALKKAKEQ